MPLSFMQQNPASAEPNTLRYRLHKALHNTQPGRSFDNVHASDLTRYDWCGRRRFILLLKNIGPKDDNLTAADRAVFDFGHAVQQVATGWFAEAGMAVGDWRCVYCSCMHRMQYRPYKCTKCGCGTFEYAERRFVSQISGISCGIDLLISDMGSKLRVVEIKSVLKDDFVKLVGPLQEHRLRTRLYLRLVQESADEDRFRIDPEIGYVLYVCKGGYVKDHEVMKWKFGDQGYTPFKDFVVERNDAETDALCTQPTAYKQAREAGVIPAGICTSQFDTAAKKCFVCQECFSGKYPVGSKII